MYNYRVMRKIFIGIFIYIMRIFYFFIKLAKTEDRKVTLISRESNEESIDFRLLRERLQADGYLVVSLCKTLDGKLSYFFHMLKQMHHIATSKVVVLDTYCIPASILKHKNDLKIIQIWHSEAAIKKFGLQALGKEGGRDESISHAMHMHENYDYIVAPSAETGRFFCEAFGYPMSKLRIYALPRIEYVWKQREQKQKANMQKANEQNTATILYAPTFRRNNRVRIKPLADAISAINAGNAINGIDATDDMHELKHELKLIVSPHPLDKNDYESECEGLAELSHGDTYDLLTECDVLISDYSSLVVEAAALGIPTFIYAYDRADYEQNNGLNIDLAAGEVKDLTFENAEVLAEELKTLLSGNRPEYSEKVRTFGDRFIEADWKNATRNLAVFIESVAREN